MNSCFFIGHADAPQSLYPNLLSSVERHITEFAVTEFLVGHYGSFDAMAARALCEAKKKYPHITLMLLLPYHPALRPVDVPEGFDGTYYPEGMERVPMALRIIEANRKAAATSSYMIAYAHYKASNSLALVEYAEKHHTVVTLLPKC